MTESDRINYIEYLVMIQGYNRSAYERMTDKQLLQAYERELGNHG